MPEPCSPAIRITVGGWEAKLKRAVSLPSRVISSSRTILITCSVGESAVITCWPNAFSPDVVDQLLDHVQVDVGFEQGHANLAQSLPDIFFGDGALAAEILEGPLEFFG